jgi:hypothetical protein
VNGSTSPTRRIPSGSRARSGKRIREQADASARSFNTRKSIRQAQGGAVYDVDGAGARGT